MRRLLHPLPLRSQNLAELSLAAVFLLTSVTPATPAIAAGAKPQIQGSQGSYTASVVVNTTPQRAWQVLTDYEGLVGVLPDIKQAKVLSRQGNRLELAHTYQAPYTFGLRIKARLAITENPPRSMGYRLISGDRIKGLQGTWTITPIPGAVRLQHRIQLDPDLPDFLRPAYFELSESNLLQSMEILRDRMEQR